MRFGKLAAAAAAAALVGAPLAANAQSAASLSLMSRAGAEMNESNGQIDSTWILPGLIFIGVGVLLVVILTEEDDGGSVSP